MNSNLQFDFTVNKENNTVNVIREFAADLELVWEAWTNPEILDLWWAPKPYRTETKSMDFREGGMWLYAMISPENVKHWCKNDYQKSCESFCVQNCSNFQHCRVRVSLGAFFECRSKFDRSCSYLFWACLRMGVAFYFHHFGNRVLHERIRW